MRQILKTMTVLALGLGLVACEKNNKNESGELSPAQQKMKAAVENYVPEVVYATYKDLADETQNLYAALHAATEKGVDKLTQAELDAICATFLKARTHWEQSEAFLYGPATTFGIDPHIDTWPLDAEALATSLSNAAQVEMLKGEDGIDRKSVV